MNVSDLGFTGTSIPATRAPMRNWHAAGAMRKGVARTVLETLLACAPNGLSEGLLVELWLRRDIADPPMAVTRELYSLLLTTARRVKPYPTAPRKHARNRWHGR